MKRADAVAAVPRRDGHYHLEGKKYPSVTTILGVLNKPGLTHWAAKTAAELVLSDPYEYDTAQKAASGIYTARDKAAFRGSTIHDLTRLLADGQLLEPSEYPESLAGYVAALKGFWMTTHPKVEARELRVVNEEHGYAGTLDLIAWVGDLLWLLDFKTSNDGRVYPEAALQLRAYANCDLPVGDVPTLGVVTLQPSGKWDLHMVDAPFEVFLAAKTVWEWLKN